MGEIFRRFFRDNMRSLASHPTANFTLQAMLGATRDPEHVAAAMQELGQDFGALMRERRAASSPRRSQRARVCAAASGTPLSRWRGG